MSVNFTYNGPQDREFFVPAGDYVLGVEKAEMALSKKGDPQINMELRVMKSDGSQGPKIFDYLGFDEKRAFKISNLLAATQKAPSKGTQLTIDEEFLAKNIVGALCWATLSVDEYQGRKSNKVMRYITNPKDDPYKLYRNETAEPKKDEDFV